MKNQIRADHGNALSHLKISIKRALFSASDYWQTRYSEGGTSGAGSYNHLAEFKAEILNRFVADKNIHSIIEFGCGDGNQLTLANYPSYRGYDVSSKAIDICRSKFGGDDSKIFDVASNYDGAQADLAISLDVIFHLIRMRDFREYMNQLFSASKKFVAIYSSDTDVNRHSDRHVRHHNFSRWVTKYIPDWHLIDHIPNRYRYNGDQKTTSFSDFYFYQHRNT